MPLSVNEALNLCKEIISNENAYADSKGLPMACLVLSEEVRRLQQALDKAGNHSMPANIGRNEWLQLRAWFSDEGRKPSSVVFRPGAAREAAYAFEVSQKMNVLNTSKFLRN